MAHSIIPLDKWLNYYYDLWHQNTLPLTLPYHETFDTEDITLDELQNVLKSMRNNKAPGKDNINVELFKYAGQTFLLRFLSFLNKIWNGQQPPKSWSQSLVIPIHKSGNRNNCDNYRGISLLNAGYKIFANIIRNKLYSYYEQILGEEQNGYRKGRSCCDGYFTMKILIEKHREFNKETHNRF